MENKTYKVGFNITDSKKRLNFRFAIIKIEKIRQSIKNKNISDKKKVSEELKAIFNNQSIEIINFEEI